MRNANIVDSLVTKTLVNGVDLRLRIAGGEVCWMHDGKVLDNQTLEDSWHTFPAGTRFDVQAVMLRTETFLLRVTEEVVTKAPNADGKTHSTRVSDRTYGIFIRGMSFDKLIDVSDILDLDADLEVSEDDVTASAPEPTDMSGHETPACEDVPEVTFAEELPAASDVQEPAAAAAEEVPAGDEAGTGDQAEDEDRAEQAA
jgi:hypothetical protein